MTYQKVNVVPGKHGNWWVDALTTNSGFRCWAKDSETEARAFAKTLTVIGGSSC